MGNVCASSEPESLTYSQEKVGYVGVYLGRGWCIVGQSIQSSNRFESQRQRHLERGRRVLIER